MNRKLAAGLLSSLVCGTGTAFAADAKIVAFFEETCGACHGAKGEGTPGLAPPLKGSKFVTESSPADIAAVISKGRTGDQKKFPNLPSPMPPHSMSDNRLQGVIAYVRDEIQK